MLAVWEVPPWSIMGVFCRALAIGVVIEALEFLFDLEKSHASREVYQNTFGNFHLISSVLTFRLTMMVSHSRTR